MINILLSGYFLLPPGPALGTDCGAPLTRVMTTVFESLNGGVPESVALKVTM